MVSKEVTGKESPYSLHSEVFKDLGNARRANQFVTTDSDPARLGRGRLTRGQRGSLERVYSPIGIPYSSSFPSRKQSMSCAVSPTRVAHASRGSRELLFPICLKPEYAWFSGCFLSCGTSRALGVMSRPVSFSTSKK